MIEITQLHKTFGRSIALNGVDLTVGRARITGIIGPNGSGKSTLMKSLLGLVTPTSGSLAIDGYRLNGSSHYRRSIGYVPQHARFPMDLTGREVLAVVKGLRPETPLLERELIALFGLEKELDKRTRAMSGGTRQKLSVVMACMYDPALLICDEPTAGLDPLSNTKLKELLLRLRQRGRTVVVTTHIMSDLEEIADDVVLLLDGQLRFAGSLDELKRNTGEARLNAAVTRLLEGGAV